MGYDKEILAQARANVRKDMEPELVEMQYELLGKIVNSALAEMKRRGIKHVEFSPFVREGLEGKLTIHTNPFGGDSVDIIQFREYCDPVAYEEYFNVKEALDDLRSSY